MNSLSFLWDHPSAQPVKLSNGTEVVAWVNHDAYVRYRRWELAKIALGAIAGGVLFAWMRSRSE